MTDCNDEQTLVCHHCGAPAVVVSPTRLNMAEPAPEDVSFLARLWGRCLTVADAYRLTVGWLLACTVIISALLVLTLGPPAAVCP